jgi:hypothetical protein
MSRFQRIYPQKYQNPPSPDLLGAYIIHARHQGYYLGVHMYSIYTRPKKTSPLLPGWPDAFVKKSPKM